MSQVFGWFKIFVITPTNHKFAYFSGYIIVSKVLNGVVFSVKMLWPSYFCEIVF
jgi:hypothetical protein